MSTQWATWAGSPCIWAWSSYTSMSAFYYVKLCRTLPCLSIPRLYIFLTMESIMWLT